MQLHFPAKKGERLETEKFDQKTNYFPRQIDQARSTERNSIVAPTNSNERGGCPWSRNHRVTASASGVGNEGRGWCRPVLAGPLSHERLTMGQPSACMLLRLNQPGRPTGPAHSPDQPIPTRPDPNQPHPAREPAGPVPNPSPRNRPGQPPPTNDPAEPLLTHRTLSHPSPRFPNPLHLTGFLPPRPGGRRFGGSPAGRFASQKPG